MRPNNHATCPFCSPTSFVAATPLAIAVRDAFPLSNGHTLVVPRRHVESLFELTADELAEVWQLVPHVRGILTTRFSPAGFTIGINDGEAAGQTVPHAHVHVIPRYRDDVPDPRGGIRWVIPEKAAYWEAPS